MVKRVDLQSLTVIAGYPWFTDWGRDTMIALPGLTLTTGRFDDFRRVIRTFLAFEKDGLLPNLFPDNEGSQLTIQLMLPCGFSGVYINILNILMI